MGAGGRGNIEGGGGFQMSGQRGGVDGTTSLGHIHSMSVGSSVGRSLAEGDSGVAMAIASPGSIAGPVSVASRPGPGGAHINSSRSVPASAMGAPVVGPGTSPGTSPSSAPRSSCMCTVCHIRYSGGHLSGQARGLHTGENNSENSKNQCEL